MKNILLSTLVIFFCFINTAILTNCTSSPQSQKPITWIKSIGYLLRSPKNYYLHYKVNGKAYRENFPSMVGFLYEGEQFYFEYNKENPEECRILYWAPTFLAGERVFYWRGDIKLIQPTNFFSKWNTVSFTYTFSGVE